VIIHGGYVIIAMRRGGMEGQHGPLFHCTSVWNFISMEKEFSRADFY
jgi:hypothetical protein